MPQFKKGLSTLDRAQASLSGKQIRRSVNEHNAKKSEVSAKIRETSLPETSEKSKPERQPEDKVSSETGPTTSTTE